MKTNYTPLERDSLAETFNIGASTASTALSQLIGVPVNVGNPDVTLDRADRCYKLIAEPDEVRTVVQMMLLGDLQGRMFLLLDPAQAAGLASAVMARTGMKDDGSGTLTGSAVLEVSNILFGASLAAIGRFLNLNVTQQVPHMVTDMAGAAVDEVFAQLGEPENDVLIVRSTLRSEAPDLSVDFLYLFDPAATRVMIGAAKGNLGSHGA